GSGQGAAGKGAGEPAGIGWLGMSSRMCLKAHLLYGGSCQLARVTCASWAGGKPVMSPVPSEGPRSRAAARAVLSWGMMRRLTEHGHAPGLGHPQYGCP